MINKSEKCLFCPNEVSDKKKFRCNTCLKKGTKKKRTIKKAGRGIKKGG